MAAGPVLFVGLGNPGDVYAHTRHNIGFHVIDGISRATGIACRRRGFSSLWGEGRRYGRGVMLLKPMTYVNRSGTAVAAFMARSGVDILSAWVVYDDLDLPLGRLRLRRGGGSGGHRGVASLLALLDGGDLGRLRVGIGRPPPEMGAREFVLQEPEDDEAEVLQRTVKRAVEAALTIVREGPEAAMNRFNGV